MSELQPDQNPSTPSTPPTAPLPVRPCSRGYVPQEVPMPCPECGKYHFPPPARPVRPKRVLLGAVALTLAFVAAIPFLFFAYLDGLPVEHVVPLVIPTCAVIFLLSRNARRFAGELTLLTAIVVGLGYVWNAYNPPINSHPASWFRDPTPLARGFLLAVFTSIPVMLTLFLWFDSTHRE